MPKLNQQILHGPSAVDAASSGQFTLVVDLDGTLTPTDTLVESIIQLVKQSPVNLMRLPFWLLKGRAAFKEAVASRTVVTAERLPYRESLLEYLRTERMQGRRVILATAAHRSIADAVALHLGCFDAVLATDGTRNLKGTAKLEAIREQVGENFVYAADSLADTPIWKAAHSAILVGVSSALAASIRNLVPIEREFPKEPSGFAVWLRAFRVHQWLKNLLLFVPLLTAFSFTEMRNLATMGLAFLSFSLTASATYMANDLWDLDSDRAHPRKRLRPFANAEIPILNGMAVAGISLGLGALLALAVSTAFFLMLVLYVLLTSAYSWVFKRLVLIDVIILSLLYTLRILAGSVAIGIATSSWLLAFSVFMFLSLALVKRCAELVSLDPAEQDATQGRDYKVADLVVLWPLGVSSALSAVVVFGLFISSADTQARYGTPALLWLVTIGLVYWLGRLWIKTARGEMHDDPVIFAIKDRTSQVIVLLMVLAMMAGHFFRLDTFF